jgi:hypothetical protein
MCNLPLMYFMDKRLKDILYPTLIATTYQNERAVAIMDMEMDISMLIKFLKFNLSEELPKILEMEQESDHTGRESNAFNKRCRSPSASSDANSNYSV